MKLVEGDPDETHVLFIGQPTEEPEEPIVEAQEAPGGEARK